MTDADEEQLTGEEQDEMGEMGQVSHLGFFVRDLRSAKQKRLARARALARRRSGTRALPATFRQVVRTGSMADEEMGDEEVALLFEEQGVQGEMGQKPPPKKKRPGLLTRMYRGAKKGITSLTKAVATLATAPVRFAVRRLKATLVNRRARHLARRRKSRTPNAAEIAEAKIWTRNYLLTRGGPLGKRLAAMSGQAQIYGDRVALGYEPLPAELGGTGDIGAAIPPEAIKAVIDIIINLIKQASKEGAPKEDTALPSDPASPPARRPTPPPARRPAPPRQAREPEPEPEEDEPEPESEDEVTGMLWGFGK
jgi:hypothetical protein